MKRLFVILVFGISIVMAASTASLSAQSIPVVELIENNKHYDGKDIVIGGEAIGHLMQRGEFAWLNISDGQAAIGVWAKKELFGAVRHFGRYAVKGDTLRIRGTFHKSCALHGGDTDIHAQALEVLMSGHTQYHIPNPTKKKILVVLIGILACLYIIKILKKRR